MVKKLDVDKLIGQFPSRFEPKPFYLPVGDAAYYYHEDTDHYAERVDCWLTVYKAFDDHRLVGFKIKNVRILLTRFDVLGLTCHVSGSNWQIMLQAMLAYIPMADESTAPQVPQYRDVLTSFGPSISDPLELECAQA